MNKSFLLGFTMLFGIHVSVEAVPPHVPKVAAGLYSLLVFTLPITIDLINSLTSPSIVYKLHKDPKAWINSFLASLVIGTLAYSILDSYTPESKFNWAMSIKQEGGLLHKISPLYVYHKKLIKAIDELAHAPDDIPDDHLFKQNCEQLSSDLKNLEIETEAFTIPLITKLWHSDERLYSIPVPAHYALSFEWASGLINMHRGLHYDLR